MGITPVEAERGDVTSSGSQGHEAVKPASNFAPLSLTFLNLEKGDDENLLVTRVQSDCEDSTSETS